ncbi:MAG: hypothetical protein ACOY5Y_16715 [Pseudomonadota bacterium]
MKIAAAALVVAALAAGSVSAAEVTDVDYLKANRCKGLATSIEGVVDVAALNSFIKAERGARAGYIIDRADDEFKRARKEARSQDRRERLTAELTGPCQAYLGGPTSVAKQ